MVILQLVVAPNWIHIQQLRNLSKTYLTINVGIECLEDYILMALHKNESLFGGGKRLKVICSH